jgi:SAM-dependent MidA family methyltransferase
MTTYHIVERSAPLQKAQRKLLGRRVRWHFSLEDALAAAGGDSFLFSNELVDAFPVRVFQRGGALQAPSPPPPGWSELHLQLRDGLITESWLAASSLPASTIFTHDWPVGQRLETHESYHAWLAAWQPRWKRGELLTIDYGGPPEAIYHRAPAGTLRAYYHHQRATGPELYTLPGRRDLTADVNFDDLVHWGNALGLETISLKSQREFLLPHFDPQSSSDADRFLIDETGLGAAFSVLRQQRR